EGLDSSGLLNLAEQEIFQISEGRLADSGPQRVGPILKTTVAKVQELFGSSSQITGVSTGFTDLDAKTAGLQKSDLIIVAGRPSMGKTSFAMNLVEHAVMGDAGAVLVFSMEMASDQLAMRMISSLGRIDQTRLRTGDLKEEDWDRFTSAVSQLKDRKLFIDDTPALTPNDLRTRARRVAREHGGLAMIMVDYLQLMRGSGQSDNRTGEISEISRSLKAIAKEMRCPVVALSQLNRALENRTDRRPVMADLRECVTGDTLVCLADGNRVPIQSLVGTKPTVVAMSSSGALVSAESDLVWRVGVRPVFRVTTQSGCGFRATAKHRIYTRDGWRTVGALNESSFIASFNGVMPAVPGSTAVAPQSETEVLHWDRIVNIEPAGEEEVFDLTVPGPESWLADGLVSHNSGAIEQDADVILFIYRDEVYNEESPDKGTAEIIIGKQRNGPTGTVRLTFIGNLTKFENLAADRYNDYMH
ncbi:MAG: replicative DNA helicase, partial [Pseudomonadota bacterium]